MVYYQWVRFKPDAKFQSTDFDNAGWVLAEIDPNWPDGGITLFGVEYNMRQSDVLEFGPKVENKPS